MENSGNLTFLTERNHSTRLRQLTDSRKKLAELLDSWLQEIREPMLLDLENLASSCFERGQQLRYISLKQDLSDHWSVFSGTVLQALSESSASPLSNSLQKKSNLQLLEEDELAEQIVIREFAARVSESCNQEMYGLEQRVAQMMSREIPPGPEENPLSPFRICNALNIACNALESVREDHESRSLLLRRMERHLHQGLPDIYHQINGALIRRGILPEIKQTFRRKPSTPFAARVHGQSEEAAASNAAISTEVMAAIQQLAAQSSTKLGEQEQAACPTAALQNPDFVSTLREFQKIDWGSLSAGDPTDSNLIWRVRHSEAADKIGHIEAATIDIVAMLFDFIFEDKVLPAGVKALVGRLQIPVLKIALQDQSFFASRDHPARYFLDDISSISLRWGGEILSTDPFYLKLEALVMRIQQEFAEDIEVFSEAIDELAGFVDERDSESKPALAAVTETATQREEEIVNAEAAQEAARAKAQAAVQPWLDKPIYPPIRDFYETHWVRVLESMALDPATTESDWNEALQFMDDLAWSISLHSRNQRTKLIGMVPRVLATIQRWLDHIGISIEDRQPFLDMLYEMHSSNIKVAMFGPLTEPEARYLPSPPNDADSHGELVYTRYVSRGVEVEEITLVGKLPLGRDEDVAAQALVQALERGDWVEFYSATENACRAMLKWVSPKKGLLVFMLHEGNRAVSISPDALTTQLRDGMAMLVEGESIFERALNGVMMSLKDSPEDVRKYTPPKTDSV